MLEKQDKAWLEWEVEQLEKYKGEVFVSKIMDPIPWHSSTSRRYNIYNNEDLDIVVDVELIETEDNQYEVIEY
jgi:hypothetical protein